MTDRDIMKARRATWPCDGAAELRNEERKVLAVLLLYGALILFAIWGVKVLDRNMEEQQEPLAVGGST
ncbi:MAG TPA: hypothetical protein VJ805_08130 [Nitrospiraceae bacterium]|nr:hypothetical protein [Nitrospiraceae bacterium]